MKFITLTRRHVSPSMNYLRAVFDFYFFALKAIVYGCLPIKNISDKRNRTNLFQDVVELRNILLFSGNVT